MTSPRSATRSGAIGGVVARADLMDCLGANSISTFGGNPVATAGARAALEYVLDHDLQANAAKQGSRLMTTLRGLPEKYAMVGDVRGRGLMLAIELVEPGTRTPSVRAANAVLEAAKAAGLLVGNGGLHGNVIRLAPPMTLTDEEADEGLQKLLTAFDQAEPSPS